MRTNALYSMFTWRSLDLSWSRSWVSIYGALLIVFRPPRADLQRCTTAQVPLADKEKSDTPCFFRNWQPLIASCTHNGSDNPESPGSHSCALRKDIRSSPTWYSLEESALRCDR